MSGGNTAPVANAGPDQTVPLGATVQLAGSESSDADNDPLSFQWSVVSIPMGSSASLSDATAVNPTFGLDVSGDYILQLIVNDGTENSAADMVTISTQNSQPVADTGPDQTLLVGSLVQLDGSGSNDADNDALSFQWSVMSVPLGSAATLSDTTVANPTFSADLVGAYEFQLIVNDGTEDSLPTLVIIQAFNTQPVADAGPDQTVFATNTVALDGSASSDADGDSLTYQWSFASVPGTSTATLDDPAAVNPSFVIDQPGTYRVELIVNDGIEDSDLATVTVSTLNSKPIAEAGPDQSVFVTATVALDASGSSDVDGDALSYDWTLLSVPTGSSATLDDPASQLPSFDADKAGTYIGQLIVNDGMEDSAADTVAITAQNRAPTANAGADQNVLLGDLVTLDGGASSDPDGDDLTFLWSFTSVPAGSTAVFSDPTVLDPSFTPDLAGIYVVQLIVNDGTVESAPVPVTITVTDPATIDDDGDGFTENQGDCNDTDPAVFPGTIEACYDGPAGTAGVGLCQAGTRTCQIDGTFSACTGQVLPGTDIPGNNLDEDCDGADTPLPIPPEPETVAPPLDRTVSTTIVDSTDFLYTGPDPIQTGVAPGTIEPQRASLVKGNVLDRAGNPIPGVKISILGRPELGATRTQPDGGYDMVVNGGGTLTIVYDIPGRLPVQRRCTPAWQEFEFVPDVVLIEPDPQVTTVDLSAPGGMQTARGSVQTDANGSRQTTMLFPDGVQAELIMPDGSSQPISTLNIRATEFTVGDMGPQAMPGQLPPTTAYTYAVELSADEVLAAAADEVRFDQPIPLYVENFLGFPAGGDVPTGFYDDEQGVWVPSTNGRVIEVVDVVGGVAQLDTDGDGMADDPATIATLGVTPEEQVELATLYTPGQSLWRTAVTFLASWDHNWPGGPPADAVPPNGADPTGNAIGDTTSLDTPDIAAGTGIAFQNQTVSQSVTLTGTPFNLNYESSRTRDRTAAYMVEVPLSGPTVPASLKRIELEVKVAGQRFRQTFPPLPNQTTTFTWDGLDAYGRVAQGRQETEIIVEFIYDLVYMATNDLGSAFGRLSNSGVTLPRDTSVPRAEVGAGRQITGFLGTWDNGAQGLGGWQLDTPRRAGGLMSGAASKAVTQGCD